MQPTLRTLVCTVAATLLGVSMSASADIGNTDQPVEGILVEDIVVLNQLPSEVKAGSIPIDKDADQALVKLANLSACDATKIALLAFPGTVSGLDLENENDFLVWNVEITAPDDNEVELLIDAGNGRLLAAGRENTEEEDNERDQSHWKFWQRNDEEDDD